MDNEEIKERIFKLRRETGAALTDCKKVILKFPDDSQREEALFYLGYLTWLRRFMDGDRSAEAYIKTIEKTKWYQELKLARGESDTELTELLH